MANKKESWILVELGLYIMRFEGIRVEWIYLSSLHVDVKFYFLMQERGGLRFHQLRLVPIAFLQV